MTLSQEQIDHYKKYGWVTVPIFPPEEIGSIRQEYHNWIAKSGVKPGKLDKKTYHQLPTGNTPHLNCYYAPFKFRFSLDERVWKAMSSLWAATFASGVEPGFEHDYGPFDPTEGFVHIDRASFRFPKSVIKSGAGSKGLDLHVDKNPFQAHKTKWQPVQMSLALVNHDGSGRDGGLGVVPGFHLEFQDYFDDNPVDHKRQFVQLKKTKHKDLWERIKFIQHPAGSLVFWDNRLPHCTAPVNDRRGGEAREVFFSTFLPNVYPNTHFAQSQLHAFSHNRIPPEFEASVKKLNADADAEPLESYDFSDVQQKLMGLQPW